MLVHSNGVRESEWGPGYQGAAVSLTPIKFSAAVHLSGQRARSLAPPTCSGCLGKKIWTGNYNWWNCFTKKIIFLTNRFADRWWSNLIEGSLPERNGAFHRRKNICWSISIARLLALSIGLVSLTWGCTLEAVVETAGLPWQQRSEQEGPPCPWRPRDPPPRSSAATQWPQGGWTGPTGGGRWHQNCPFAAGEIEGGRTSLKLCTFKWLWIFYMTAYIQPHCLRLHCWSCRLNLILNWTFHKIGRRCKQCRPRGEADPEGRYEHLASGRVLFATLHIQGHVWNWCLAADWQQWANSILDSRSVAQINQ